jgi:Ca2+/Na+ antiporter
MAFTYVMVDGSERVGCIMGIKQVIMGLIVLAAGTSVPDMISSIVVAKAGKGDMAVANAVGSNTFDLLLGLGAPWLLRTISDGPIEVPTEKLGETIIILSLCLVGYVAILAKSGWTLTRNAGIAMLVTYACVISYVLAKELNAQQIVVGP